MVCAVLCCAVLCCVVGCGVWHVSVLSKVWPAFTQGVIIPLAEVDNYVSVFNGLAYSNEPPELASATDPETAVLPAVSCGCVAPSRHNTCGTSHGERVS